MVAGDTSDVAAVTQELGYQATPDQVEQRFVRVSASPNQGLFVAHRRKVLVGWAHVHGVVPLHAASHASVVSLFVRSELRGQGIGQALLRACREWAEANGYADLRLP